MSEGETSSLTTSEPAWEPETAPEWASSRRRVLNEETVEDPQGCQQPEVEEVEACIEPVCVSSSSSSSGPSRGTRAPDPTRSENPGTVLEEDWREEYEACPVWGPVLNLVEDKSVDDWPKGVRFQNGRLYQDGLLCVPQGLMGRVIRAHHGMAGHSGATRLWHQMGRWYAFA